MGLFISENKRNLKKLEKIVCKIEALDEVYAKKTDAELKETTNILKQRLADGETLNDILPDAFAVVREASSRVLKQKHFHVQLVGGVVIHQGRIAQMRTGEGKTLMATLPAYLNALTGKGVHVVTVNEYLATTQAQQMSKVYNFLGVSVGVITAKDSHEQKVAAYNCDITYGTNNEFGFDYLRDNMVTHISQRVQRGHAFAIVDEVDSILIDEARTPLIISGKGTKSSEVYVAADMFAKSLREDDYEIDVKKKTIVLSESGVEKAERYFKLESLSDINNIELNHYINNALRARYIFKRDDNYIVEKGEIIIVDEFTGRLMEGRRYSDGLHQAIEAKENVKIKDENKTLATITFQNYFRLYKKLSGMTGTAKTEEIEFNKIYLLDVVEIPTNRPMIRYDEPDIIYKTEKAKIAAVVQEVKELYEKGQPVLVGTVTVEKSEAISAALKAEKIPHNVLNAKNHHKEAELVAQAGRYKSVTIATNMAGRGTDILLGGNPEFLAKNQLLADGYNEAQINLATSYTENKSEEMQEIFDKFKKYHDEFKVITDAEKEKVVELGGLRIIGTERHESRRIDDQLRGRAGRQGDPGSSVFYISMEDDLVRRFGGDLMLKAANALKIDDNVPFQVRMLSRGVESSQKKIEGQNFAVRKNVLEYDDVMNIQRFNIYEQRNKVLEGADIHDEIVYMIEKTLESAVNECVDGDKSYLEWDLDKINATLEEKKLFLKDSNFVTSEYVEDCDIDDLYEKLRNDIMARYEDKIAKTKEIGFDFSDLERMVLLRVVDMLWMDHIDQMSILKNEIGLQGYGNKNPVDEYKREGRDLFYNMIERIWYETTAVILNINVERAPAQQNARPKEIIPMVRAQAQTDKVAGRNDPCPCGSGRKYKNCCGK